jgi:hypothetical protein
MVADMENASSRLAERREKSPSLYQTGLKALPLVMLFIMILILIIFSPSWFSLQSPTTFPEGLQVHSHASFNKTTALHLAPNAAMGDKAIPRRIW